MSAFDRRFDPKSVRGMAVVLAAFLVIACTAGGCHDSEPTTPVDAGASESPGSDAPLTTAGSFSWVGDGMAFSNTGYYQIAPSSPPGSFAFTISSDYAVLTIPCWLKGQLKTVPPGPGTYSIVAADAQVDGTFIGGCSTTGRAATVYADPSVSGTVTLTQSRVGLVEGLFTMSTRPNPGLVGMGSSTDFTGAFSVGCQRPVGDPSCTGAAAALR